MDAVSTDGPGEGTRIRVLLVDDHQVVRRGLRTFLDLQDDIEVVGEAADGAAGVALAKSLAPDVILMDLMMPVLDGVSAITAVKAAQPEVEIVAVTSFIEEDKVTAALEAGSQRVPAQGCGRRCGRQRRARGPRRRGPPRPRRGPAAGPADARAEDRAAARRATHGA